jgi:hypothetical protein
MHLVDDTTVLVMMLTDLLDVKVVMQQHNMASGRLPHQRKRALLTFVWWAYFVD